MNLSKKALIVCVVLFIFLSMASIHAEQSEDLNSTDTKTYTDLDVQINETDDGGTLNLADNYKYDESKDNASADGVKISKSITIAGGDNLASIDGSSKARVFYIESNCNVIFKNLIIKNGYSTASGAGIYLMDNSNLTLINCILQNNRVYNSNGGAINAQSSTNIKIDGCTFDNNTSIRESDQEWAKFKAGMGSAIIVRIDSYLEIIKSTFTNNDAYLSTILVVSYDDVRYKLSKLLVRDCKFEYNTVYNCGIIYLDERGTGEILDSVFNYNTNTHSGGVLELDACNSCTVKGCTFNDNVGTSGGAIKVKVFNTHYLSYVDIINCNFNSNYVKNYGGAIYSSYGVVKISNCNFNYNSAAKHGGAVYTDFGQVQIDNCKFNQNEATKFGGAIYSQNGPVKISNCKFTQNAANKGGGLYLISTGSSVASSSFTKNEAVTQGGAVYSTVGDVKVSSITYSKNTATNGAKVYGAFLGKIYQYTYTTKSVKLKVKLTSPWQMALNQQVKVKITGPKSFTSKWVKANANGIVYIIVPFKVNIAKSKITVSMKEGVCIVKSWTKVKDKATLKYPKSVKKRTKIKVTVKNKATKALIKKTKFTVKVYTGKKFKTYHPKTSAKGKLTIGTVKMSRGKHKIFIILSNANYNINNKIFIRVK